MSFSTGFRKCKKCGKMLFGLFDGDLCDECEKVEQGPTEKITNDVWKDFKKRKAMIEQEPCTDAVSRQAVLDVIYGQHIGGKEAVEHGLRNTYAGDLREIADEIIALPSVQPKSETVTEFADRCRECGKHYVKRQTGKWLYKEITDDYRVTGQCSECKERKIIDNFCPNCGADMRESEDKE